MSSNQITFIYTEIDMFMRYFLAVTIESLYLEGNYRYTYKLPEEMKRKLDLKFISKFYINKDIPTDIEIYEIKNYDNLDILKQNTKFKKYEFSKYDFTVFSDILSDRIEFSSIIYQIRKYGLNHKTFGDIIDENFIWKKILKIVKTVSKKILHSDKFELKYDLNKEELCIVINTNISLNTDIKTLWLINNIPPIISARIETSPLGIIRIKLKYNVLFRQLFVNDYPNLDIKSFLSTNIRRINKIIKDTINKAKK